MSRPQFRRILAHTRHAWLNLLGQPDWWQRRSGAAVGCGIIGGCGCAWIVLQSLCDGYPGAIRVRRCFGQNPLLRVQGCGDFGMVHNGKCVISFQRDFAASACVSLILFIFQQTMEH